MSFLQSDTLELQNALGNFCRTNELNENFPLSRPENIKHYRRLVRNIIDDSLSTVYPITKSLLDEDEWNHLVYDFFANHACSNPQVWRMPKELVDYFEKSDYHNALEKPFLLDLLKFEWAELEIFAQKDEEFEPKNSTAEIKNSNLHLNPYTSLLHLEYPVHQLNKSPEKLQKGNYFILCYRKYSDDSVHYLELPLFFALCFENLSENSNNLIEILNLTATQINLELNTEQIQQSEEFFMEMLEKEVIYLL